MSNGIPAFAQVAPNNNNNVNNPNNNLFRNTNNETQNNLSPNLPMWAVVLIIVFLIFLFVAIVSTYFYCKRKLKKKKMKKNRMMLQMSGQQYQQSFQNHSLWENGWNNGGYEGNETMKSAYYAGQTGNWTQNNFNMLTEKKFDSVKNNTSIRNETETLKRKAPAPPGSANPDQLYENLRVNGNKPKTIRKAPQPPNHEDSLSVTSETTTVKNVPAIMKETHHELANSRRPTSQPLITRSESRHQAELLSDDDTDATTYASQSESEFVETEENSTEVTSHKETTTSALETSPENDYEQLNDQSNGNLMGILTQWKEHLFAQKNELQEYYNRLTGYVESVAIQPMDSVSNIGMNQHSENQFSYDTDQRKEMNKKKRRLPSYPVPPESVLDEVRYPPDDIEGQQKVISDLRARLSELEQLLQNPNELEEESKQKSIDQKNQQFAIQRYSLQKQQNRSIEKQILAKQSSSLHSKYKAAPKDSSSSKNKTCLLQKNERITLQKLLAQLDRKDGEHLMKKIIKFQQMSKQHAQVMTLNGNKEQIASLRLARQVHHVMRDVVNPRLQTNMFLATAAACNLTSKITKSLYMGDKEKFENFQDLAKLLDRLTGLVRHMNDMSRQLSLRIESYYKEDFYRFIDAFLVMAMKVLNTTNSFIINAKIRIITKEKKQEPNKEPIKSENVGNGQIRNDVEQLSDGLTKLENLLQSGKLPSLELSSLPKNKRQTHYSFSNNNDESDSCGSDCDTYSYTSCSTCFPNVGDLEKTPRNPYLFPGNTTVKTVSNDVNQTINLPSDYGNIRPPTRPQNDKRYSQTSCSEFQKTNRNSYMSWKPDDAFNQPASFHEINDRSHEVMLAKYLNELLKTQSDKHPLTLPPTSYNKAVSKDNIQKQNYLEHSREKIPKSTNKKQSKTSSEKRSKKKHKNVSKKKNKQVTSDKMTAKDKPEKNDNLKSSESSKTAKQMTNSGDSQLKKNDEAPKDSADKDEAPLDPNGVTSENEVETVGLNAVTGIEKQNIQDSVETSQKAQLLDESSVIIDNITERNKSNETDPELSHLRNKESGNKKNNDHQNFPNANQNNLFDSSTESLKSLDKSQNGYDQAEKIVTSQTNIDQEQLYSLAKQKDQNQDQADKNSSEKLHNVFVNSIPKDLEDENDLKIESELSFVKKEEDQSKVPKDKDSSSEVDNDSINFRPKNANDKDDSNMESDRPHKLENDLTSYPSNTTKSLEQSLESPVVDNFLSEPLNLNTEDNKNDGEEQDLKDLNSGLDESDKSKVVEPHYVDKNLNGTLNYQPTPSDFLPNLSSDDLPSESDQSNLGISTLFNF